MDGYWKEREKSTIEMKGLTPESSEAQKEKKEMTQRRKGWRPLVEVGPFFIFHSVENGRSVFTVVERSTLVLLTQLISDERSKELRLFSSLEKGWNFPRFSSRFRYSEDGIYKDAIVSVFWKDGTRKSDYIDSTGKGIFDTMYAHQDGKSILYSLNGLTWEQVDEPLQDVESDRDPTQWPAGWPGGPDMK